MFERIVFGLPAEGRHTDRARKVFCLAIQEAQRFNHDYIGPEHLLLGLAKEGNGVAANVLKNFGVDLGKLRSMVEQKIGRGDYTMVLDGKLGNSKIKPVVERAIEECRSLGHNYIGTEHLLLALTADLNSTAYKIIQDCGVDPGRLRTEILDLLGPSEEVAKPTDTRQSIKEIIRSVVDSGLERQVELLGITSGITKVPAEPDSQLREIYHFLTEYDQGRYILSEIQGVEPNDRSMLTSILEASHQRGALVRLSGKFVKGHDDRKEEPFFEVESVQLGEYKIETSKKEKT